jgi:hypothetical protein
MPIIGELPNGRLLVREAVAGPNPYDEGTPPTVVFTDLKQGVEAVLSCYIDSAGASYVAVPAGVSGRTLTVRIVGQVNTPGADGAAFRQVVVGDTVNLSARTITAVAVGT